MEKKDYHALFRINQLETEGGKCKGGDTMFGKCTYCTCPKLECLLEKAPLSLTCRLSYILARIKSYSQSFLEKLISCLFVFQMPTNNKNINPFAHKSHTKACNEDFRVKGL